MNNSFVYFLKPIGMSGPFKIGCSQAPYTRLETFMSWSPFRLEMIGQVPGSTQDENYLHRCFWDQRSHCEWFHYSNDLRSAIDRIITLGSVPRDIVAAEVLKTKPGRKRTPEQSRIMSYRMRLDWALRKMRTKDGYWSAPADIRKILDDWSCGYRGVSKTPSPEEFERLESYLNNPSDGATFYAYRKVAA